MVQFTIVNESLKIIDDTKTVVFIAKKDVFAISQSLYQVEPIADIYNLNLGYLGLVFTRKLSECLDPDGDVFTVDSFILFVETYLGFETGVIPQTITVVLNYSALPDPTTVSGEFYWCEEVDGIYPIGLYYSDGVAWQYPSGGGGSQNLQQVVNEGNGISNFGGTGTASMQSTNFVNNRTLYLNNDSNPTIKFEDNLDGTNYAIFDIDTLNLSGVIYNWSNIVAQDLQVVTDNGSTTTNSIEANSFIKDGATYSDILAGDGSVITAGQNISISAGQISALGGAGGGSYVFYYLNGGTVSTVPTYYQMSNTPVIGTGVDFTRNGNGLITQWLTDIGNPNRLEITAGTWNFEIYMSASNNAGTPAFYVELLKYDGSTFSTISNNSASPEGITNGTTIDLYLTSIAIPQTVLLSTDRLALRFYIVNNTSGRVITMHTQDSHICQVITNFAGGITALNGLTVTTQNFATGTSGTDFNVVSAINTHTFNMPSASATARGVVTTSSQTIAGAKTFNSAPILNSLVDSEILALDASKNIQSLAVATYPSLTELSYVKGVTSAIQAQIDAKGSGTVTSVSAITLGTSGTDLTSTVATGTTTPVITLNVPSASATARGVITTGSQTIAGTKTFSSNILMPAVGTPLILSVGSGGVIEGLPISTFPDLTQLSYVKGVTSAIQTQLDYDASATQRGAVTTTSQTFAGVKTFTGIVVSTQIANTIASFDGSKNLLGLSTSTYPSLTELSYVKGVTSAIQTQIDSKQFGTIIVTSGTSFTTPSNITTSTIFLIEIVGAGGGGGGSPNTALAQGSSGGGGGYVYKKITGLTASTTYTCAIGTGGSAGAFASNGTAGGNTTLTIGAVTYTASGGGLGIGAVSSAGGAGGTGTNGDINITGQNGGSVGTATVTNQAGGGNSPKGWGLGGQTPNANANGVAGTGYGGGGSAGHGNTGAPTGGAGANGIIYCTYYN